MIMEISEFQSFPKWITFDFQNLQKFSKTNKNIQNITMEIKSFTITKRDGSKDKFSLDKIMNAIVKAFE